MPDVLPFHSIEPEAAGTVYHDNASCSEGKKIEGRYLLNGTGGRSLCDHCLRHGFLEA